MSSNQKIIDELKSLKPLHQRLEISAKSIVQHQLQKSGIDTLELSHRIKTVESATSKISQKNYTSPIEQLTDLVGFRVTVFLEKDVKKVEDALRATFDVIEEHCVDKRKKSIDTVGYRSLHLVCSLGESRSQVPEYSDICYLPFEIQIRTALEHTWAQIEHKQNYKGKNTLPVELQRRLMILSGALELLDKEFSNIVVEAELYVEGLKTKNEDFDGDSISKIALTEIFVDFLARNALPERAEIRNNTASVDDLIVELSSFKIDAVADLRKFLDDSKLTGFLVEPTREPFHLHGFYRSALILSDPQRFFETVARHEANYAYDTSFLERLEEISGRDDILTSCSNSNVDFIHA
ncbi:RelA/SpoT domain-containing protein [Planktotalea sp.]|uniref:GTP pyrophosphokinase n=1 Tax=Planktotalea sp. TaxID=2029877 RepID=UPI00329856C8